MNKYCQNLIYFYSLIFGFRLYMYFSFYQSVCKLLDQSSLLFYGLNCIKFIVELCVSRFLIQKREFEL